MSTPEVSSEGSMFRRITARIGPVREQVFPGSAAQARSLSMEPISGLVPDLTASIIPPIMAPPGHPPAMGFLHLTGRSARLQGTGLLSLPEVPAGAVSIS